MKTTPQTTPEVQDTPSIEVQIAELIAAGWTRKTHDVWTSPRGNYLFRGPHGAWRVMRWIKGADAPSGGLR